MDEASLGAFLDASALKVQAFQRGRQSRKLNKRPAAKGGGGAHNAAEGGGLFFAMMPLQPGPSRLAPSVAPPRPPPRPPRSLPASPAARVRLEATDALTATLVVAAPVSGVTLLTRVWQRPPPAAPYLSATVLPLRRRVVAWQCWRQALACRRAHRALTAIAAHAMSCRVFAALHAHTCHVIGARAAFATVLGRVAQQHRCSRTWLAWRAEHRMWHAFAAEAASSQFRQNALSVALVALRVAEREGRARRRTLSGARLALARLVCERALTVWFSWRAWDRSLAAKGAAAAQARAHHERARQLARWRQRYDARCVMRRVFSLCATFHAHAIALGEGGLLWRLVRRLYDAWTLCMHGARAERRVRIAERAADTLWRATVGTRVLGCWRAHVRARAFLRATVTRRMQAALRTGLAALGARPAALRTSAALAALAEGHQRRHPLRRGLAAMQACRDHAQARRVSWLRAHLGAWRGPLSRSRKKC